MGNAGWQTIRLHQAFHSLCALKITFCFPKDYRHWTLSQYFQHRVAKVWFNGVVEVDIDVKSAWDKIQAILDSWTSTVQNVSAHLPCQVKKWKTYILKISVAHKEVNTPKAERRKAWCTIGLVMTFDVATHVLIPPVIPKLTFLLPFLTWLQTRS